MTARVALLFILPVLAPAAPDNSWEHLMTKAADLTQSGQFNAAEETYRHASAAAADEVSASVTRIAIGRLRLEEGQVKEAERVWRSELLRVEASGLITLPEVLCHLGHMYISLRRYREAEDVFVRCARHARENTKATALFGLGTVYDVQGRHREAAAALVEALSIVGDKGDFDTASIQYKLASVYSRLRRNDEADEMFERSLHSARTAFGSDDARLAVPIAAFADHLQRTGRKRRAKELRDSVKILQAQDAPERRHTVTIRTLRDEEWGTKTKAR
jgi:tetratricopeptide (TPR) repeat protein